MMTKKKKKTSEIVDLLFVWNEILITRPEAGGISCAKYSQEFSLLYLFHSFNSLSDVYNLALLYFCVSFSISLRALDLHLLHTILSSHISLSLSS